MGTPPGRCQAVRVPKSKRPPIEGPEPPHAAPTGPVASTPAATHAPAAQQTAGLLEGRPSSPVTLLRLQRAAGNRAVSRAVARQLGDATGLDAVQRVAVPVEYSETLQQNGAAGATSYVPSTYSIKTTSPSRSAAGETRPSRYQLTRGRSSVDVEVRIKFIDPVNGRQGVGVELPAETAADQRRSQATSVCQRLVGMWNGQFGFFATRQDPVAGVPEEAETIDLPVRFTATPVFDIDAEADAAVNLHLGQAGPGAAFDAGNYYRLMANGRPAPDSVYAHEYGHLLGLPDEYNQSNPQAHAILHDAAVGAGAPSASPAMTRRLDDATRRLMVLQAVRPHLTTAINGIAGTVSTAFATQQRLLVNRLWSVMRQAWRDRATIDGLVATYSTALAGVDGATRRLPEVVAFEARDNLSYYTIAQNAVTSALSPASFGTLVRSAFTNAMQSALTNASRILINIAEDQSPVSTPGVQTMDISIDTIGVTADSALNTAAQQMAAATTGAAPAGPAPAGPTGAAPATPALTPSTTLLSALQALPAPWATVDNLFAGPAAQLPGLIQAAAASLAAAPTLTDPSARALYRYMYNDIAVISADTARSTINAFLTLQLTPLLNSQLEQIVGSIQSEADSHTAVSSSGGTDASAGAPAPDPALSATAATMNQRIDAMMTTATAGNSHVRYTVNSLMGNDRQGTSIRNEQMNGILAQFNANLRQPDESEFQTRGNAP